MTSPDVSHPKTFAQYELLEKLEASPRGLSFKARHRSMGRIVVLKMLTAQAAASAQLMERFNRKARILSALDHRNVVKAYEAGVHQGVPYIVTEFIDGYDLRELLKRFGPLPVMHAVGYVFQAAAGLGYAHGKGVCHRNIKPSNLMVDKQGLVKVIGLGLARLDVDLADGQTPAEITVQGQAMGSCDFMAPEQAADAHSVDPRADVYSLGCTLHALLIGRPPYSGKSPLQQALAHRGDPIPSLCALRPDVPEALDAVFRKMLAKKPEERYGSMAEVQSALQASMVAADSSVQPARQNAAQQFNALLRSLGQDATLTWCPSSGQQAGNEAPAAAQSGGAGGEDQVASSLWTRIARRFAPVWQFIARQRRD